MEIVLKTRGTLTTISLVLYFVVALPFVWGAFRSKGSVGGETLDVAFIRFKNVRIVGDDPSPERVKPLSSSCMEVTLLLLLL